MVVIIGRLDAGEDSVAAGAHRRNRRARRGMRERATRGDIVLVFPLTIVGDNLLPTGAERSKQARRLLKLLGFRLSGSSMSLVLSRVVSGLFKIVTEVLDDTSELQFLGLLTMEQTPLALDGALGVVE
jgi:hypothetical protein